MNITLDDNLQKALVSDWQSEDAAAWVASPPVIPNSYTIEFMSLVDESVLASLNTGRNLNYDPRTQYVTEVFGTGYVSKPVTTYVQQLLPLINTG